MTNDQRELAEYVARWAGWTRSDKSHGFVWFDPFRALYVKPEKTLSDLALAWRAQEELIEEVGYRKAMHEVHAYVCGQGCTRIEATHRALRATRGGE